MLKLSLTANGLGDAMLRSCLALCLLPTLFLSVPAQAQTGYRISEHGGGLGFYVDLTVVFTPMGGGRWVAERAQHRRFPCKPGPDGSCVGERRQHDWIDGATCPQLTQALRDLAQVRPPAFAGPDTQGFGVVADATLLTVEGGIETSTWPTPTQGERMSVSEYGGPFSSWWRRSEKALDGCWRPAAPVIGGQTILPQLADPA
jgi:hypothetical protein